MAKKTDKPETKTTLKATAASVATVKELRGKSVAELQAALVAAKADLAEARRSLVAGELISPSVISKLRKSIARIETLIREAVQTEVNGKEDK